VVFVHFGQSLPEDWLLVKISKFGQYGVQLFFVLSALTLCHSLNKIEDFNRLHYLGFIVRRFFRIAPLYYVAIPAYFIFTYLCFYYLGKSPFTNPSDYSIVRIVSNVLFVHGFYPSGNNSIVPGGWSIGCEFLFYAIFPVLFIASKKRKVWLAYFSFSAALITGLMILLRFKFGSAGTYEVGNNSFIYFSIFNQAPCFVLGMLYFYFSGFKLMRITVFAIAPICMALLVYAHDSFWGALFTPALSGVLAVFLISLLDGVGINLILKKLGQLSFSIYICHFIPVWGFRYVFKKLFPVGIQSEAIGFLGFIVVVVITYLIAYFTNRFIENPFIKLGHQISEKIQPNQALQRMNCVVTDRAPSSTLRANAVHR
jgi:peptidoglycan/LPS O-acetylase OafA/YrhL